MSKLSCQPSNMGNPFYDPPCNDGYPYARVPHSSWRRMDPFGEPYADDPANQPGLASVVSMALGVSYASRNWDYPTSNRSTTYRQQLHPQNTARFQQRQLQEKEQKLLQLLESQQQRVLQRVSGGRSSAGSSNSSTSSTSSNAGTGKVRLMFEERRTTVAAPPPRRGARSGPAATTGWDRSYPLDPLTKARPPGPASAGRPIAARPAQKTSTYTRPKADLDVSLRPMKATSLIRDTNANRISPNDDLQNTVFGKLSNVGLRNGANNNSDDDVTDVPAPRKPTVRALQEPRIRPAPAKREPSKPVTNIPSSRPAAAAVPARPRIIPPSPAKSSGSSSAGSLATSPEPRKPMSANRSNTNSAPPAPALGPIPPGMAECDLCGRRFAEDRIDKHEEICRKTKTKKRKVFDPVKMRAKGTEVESYVVKKNVRNTTSVVKKAAEPAAKKSDWRKKHEDFIESIRNAKKVQQHIAAGGKASDLPPPKPLDTSDYIQCPHCSRKFAEGAAERHIPRCANIKSNKPAPAKAPPRRR